jgi:RNA polymerase sigma-70 factor (ECF subfamily)
LAQVSHDAREECDGVLWSAQVWRRGEGRAARVGSHIGSLVNSLLATLIPARDDRPSTNPDRSVSGEQAPLRALTPFVAPSSDFDRFFSEHEQHLYAYIRRLVLSDEVALDIAQEAFVRAWQRFDTLRTYERPAAWVYRVATNLAISHLRRHFPLPLSQATHAPRSDRSDASADDELLVDPTDFTGATVERDLINFVLRRLPERQRAALLLRAVHGFSCEEIAATLDLSPVAARQTLSRGRERFRALYVAAHHERDEPRS